MITGVSVPRTFSLRYHNELKLATKWAIRQDDFPASTVHNLQSDIWKYIRKKEIELSWPSLLPGDIVNLSFNGSHYLGHYLRLKKYLETHSKPDLVIVTDYEFNHVAYTLRFDNQRYFFESLTRSNLSNEIEKQRNIKMKEILAKSKNWHSKLHRRGFHKLVSVLEEKAIGYKIMRFGQFSDQNQKIFDDFLGCDIDCKDIRLSYTTNYKNLEYGAEISKKKLEAQQLISNRVCKLL